MTKLSPYWKCVVAIVGALCAPQVLDAVNGVQGGQRIAHAVIGLATALGVYAKANS